MIMTKSGCPKPPLPHSFGSHLTGGGCLATLKCVLHPYARAYDFYAPFSHPGKESPNSSPLSAFRRLPPPVRESRRSLRSKRGHVKLKATSPPPASSPPQTPKPPNPQAPTQIRLVQRPARIPHFFPSAPQSGLPTLAWRFTKPHIFDAGTSPSTRAFFW